MNEVKTPKKNWFYYYTIVLLILIILNTFIMPLIQQHSVKEVDYGTFISMTEKKEIGKVEIESNQIVFTNKDESQIYKTGLMDDPNRTERLYAHSDSDFPTALPRRTYSVPPAISASGSNRSYGDPSRESRRQPEKVPGSGSRDRDRNIAVRRGRRRSGRLPPGC